MTKKVEKNTLYRLLFRNLFSDHFLEIPSCSVTKPSVTPSSMHSLISIKDEIAGPWLKGEDPKSKKFGIFGT